MSSQTGNPASNPPRFIPLNFVLPFLMGMNTPHSNVNAPQANANPASNGGQSTSNTTAAPSSNPSPSSSPSQAAPQQTNGLPPDATLLFTTYTFRDQNGHTFQFSSAAPGFSFAPFLHMHQSSNDFERFMREAFENGPRGKPPASAKVIDSLPMDFVREAGVICSVCQDECEVATAAAQLPCKHMYHKDCIIPWLKQHNTCPQCRYELLTDDEEYNRSIQQRNSKMTSATPAVSPAPSNNCAAMDIDHHVTPANPSVPEVKCQFSNIYHRDCVLLGEPTMQTLQCGHSVHTECLSAYNRIRGSEHTDSDHDVCPECRQRSQAPPLDRSHAITVVDIDAAAADKLSRKH